MGSGTGSTLIIRPEGLTALTMGLAASEPYAGSTPYIVPLQTLDWGEELRWQIVYDQAPPGEGGEAVNQYGPLVPVVFQVVIKATTRAGMIDAYNDLQAALLNRKGGMIQYKPEDVGAGVLSTYYHYVQSRPPRLLDTSGNRWDASAKSDGKFTLYVEVEFRTQPIATSDPDNPVTLSDLTATIQNWVDDSPSQTNRVTMQATNLLGSMPALLRILARPAASQYLGRLIMFRRSDGTLANFVNVYEAEDASAIYPSAAWTSVNDSDRGDGAYMRCLPAEDANGVAQGLRFTISNPGDHQGRFAIFGVGYDDADATGVWTHQAKVVAGNVAQEGASDYEAVALRNWQLIYVGEFELPVAPLSAVASGYDTGPYIEWYSARASGTSEFRLDGLLLVYVSDEKMQPCALDAPCEDERGVTNSEKLLVENFLDEYGMIREISQVVAQSDNDFKRMLSSAPRGDFITLDPTQDHLLVFVQEEFNGILLDDDFETYAYSRWFLIDDFEDLDWVTFTADTTNYVEGDQSGKGVASGTTTFYKVVSMDLENEGRFDDGDYVVIVLYGDDVADLSYWLLRFDTDASNYYYKNFTGGDKPAAGWNFLKVKKSDFLTTGSPDWSDITRIAITIAMASGSVTIEHDHFRVEKADPDDSTNPNVTGDQWNVQPVGGLWTVTEDISGAGATLACLDLESGVEKSALIDETTPADVQFRARVMAKRDAGYAGILWRAGNDTLTEGAEDCYAALLDITNDVLLVREYAAGSITQHDNPAFTCAVDTWYVVGVVAKGSTFKIYATAASNLSDDDDVFSATYLLSTVTDATLTSGQCGVMSISTLGRFDEANLVSLQDKVIPANEITLEGKAIFRTIAPFCE